MGTLAGTAAPAPTPGALGEASVGGAGAPGPSDLSGAGIRAYRGSLPSGSISIALNDFRKVESDLTARGGMRSAEPPQPTRTLLSPQPRAFSPQAVPSSRLASAAARDR